MNYWYVLPPAAVATGITSLVARAGTFRADARADRLNQQAEVGEQARKPDAPECGMPQRGGDAVGGKCLAFRRFGHGRSVAAGRGRT